MPNRQTQDQQQLGSRNQGTSIPDDDEDEQQCQANVVGQNPEIRQTDGNRASQQNTAADFADDDSDSNDDAGEDDVEDEEEGGGAGRV